MFMIYDITHAEPQDGNFNSFEEALTELKRRAGLPWNEEPNKAPCKSWRTCHRIYEIVEYNTSTQPWTEFSRVRVLDVSSAGVQWLFELPE
jgi:hypothetical protein